MKCQNCEKPATFHITDLTGPELVELHLCAECAREHLQPSSPPGLPAPTISGVLEKQLALGQTAEELRELDARNCPMCGITFLEFRQSGRLGCPHDYEVFSAELEALLTNIHGSDHHTGKRPLRPAANPAQATQTIRLRRELREAVEQEDYERASQLRDRIRRFEEQADARA